jgi:hypothetical protein
MPAIRAATEIGTAEILVTTPTPVHQIVITVTGITVLITGIGIGTGNTATIATEIGIVMTTGHTMIGDTAMKVGPPALHRRLRLATIMTNHILRTATHPSPGEQQMREADLQIGATRIADPLQSMHEGADHVLPQIVFIVVPKGTGCIVLVLLPVPATMTTPLGQRVLHILGTALLIGTVLEAGEDLHARMICLEKARHRMQTPDAPHLIQCKQRVVDLLT